MNPETALLIIDVQTELFQKPAKIYKAQELLANLQALADYAHNNAIPVFYVQHSSKAFLIKGTPGWQLHPQLQPLDQDRHIFKLHPSAFEETELKAELELQGIKKLVIAGLVTHGCVKATSLDALKKGYLVTLVGDAHSSYSNSAAKLIDEWNAKIQKAGARLMTTKEWVGQA